VNAGDLTVQIPPDEPVIRFQRFFAGPPDLVFRAWTEPELLLRWFGPPDIPLVECSVDLRVGGEFRFVHRAANGRESRYGGRYTEIEPGRRLVYRVVYDVWPDRESVEALDFRPVTGGTLLSGVATHRSLAWRDEMVGLGMERGQRAGYARLDLLLKELT
jgi:uncharacterized protein YndB with AHSA1/START domain